MVDFYCEQLLQFAYFHCLVFTKAIIRWKHSFTPAVPQYARLQLTLNKVPLRYFSNINQYEKC